MRRTSAIVLALALLVAAALIFRREMREEKPPRPPKPAPIVEAPPAPPLPEAVVFRPEPPKPPPPPPPRPKPPERSLEDSIPADLRPPLLGIIRGSVKIQGTPPRRKFVRMDSDPKCSAMHAGPVPSDTLVVDANGGVQWAFAYVQWGLKGQPPRTPQIPVTLDQVACSFTPHVIGLRVGQPLLILNSDDLLHTVHAFPLENKEFNVNMPRAGSEHLWRFTKPEIMVKLRCDLHPWMGAWVGVLDHPYFSVTNETGSYGIPGLPPGRYTIQVWHEQYASVAREVDLPEGGDVALDFILDARKQ